MSTMFQIRDIRRCFPFIGTSDIQRWMKSGFVAYHEALCHERKRIRFTFEEIVHCGVIANLSLLGVMSLDTMVIHVNHEHKVMEYASLACPQAFFETYRRWEFRNVFVDIGYMIISRDCICDKVGRKKTGPKDPRVSSSVVRAEVNVFFCNPHESAAADSEHISARINVMKIAEHVAKTLDVEIESDFFFHRILTSKGTYDFGLRYCCGVLAPEVRKKTVEEWLARSGNDKRHSDITKRSGA